MKACGPSDIEFLALVHVRIRDVDTRLVGVRHLRSFLGFVLNFARFGNRIFP